MHMHGPHHPSFYQRFKTLTWSPSTSSHQHQGQDWPCTCSRTPLPQGSFSWRTAHMPSHHARLAHSPRGKQERALGQGSLSVCHERRWRSKMAAPVNSPAQSMRHHAHVHALRASTHATHPPCTAGGWCHQPQQGPCSWHSPACIKVQAGECRLCDLGPGWWLP